MLVFRWIMSLIFIVQMYLSMAVIGIVFLPWALVQRRGAHAAAHAFCAWVIVTARLLCGLRSEVRGTPPVGEVLIAAKHQSFFDILLIYHAVPRGRFIMKRELMYAPVLGLYAARMGCVFVDRGKRGAAIAKMRADVAKSTANPGQMIIYPQGTRVAPGVVKPYKIGSGLLYTQLAQPCVPVGTNVGHFWPRQGILRKPGVAVIEFLPAIAPGLPVPVFMKELEATIEATSDRLLVEARQAG